MKPVTIPVAIASLLYGPKYAFPYQGRTASQQEAALKRLVKRAGISTVYEAIQELRVRMPHLSTALDEVILFISQQREFSPFAEITYQEFKEGIEGGQKFSIPLDLFWVMIGIALEEMLAELKAGRLVAHGTPLDDGSYAGMIVSGDSMVAWLDNLEDPGGVKFKALATFKQDGEIH